MKYAVLITAYNDFDLLEKQVNYLRNDAYLYIHIDKKSKIPNEIITRLEKVDNTKIIRKYKIYWGSYKHILAIIDLLKMAYDDGCEYYSIVSENTITVKPIEEIVNYFEKNIYNIYMEVKSKKDNNSFSEFDFRYKSYFFQDIYNHRSRCYGFRIMSYYLERISAYIQRAIGIRKGIEFNYKGYVYCHMSRIAVQRVLEKVKEDASYLKELRRCYVGEEFFFQNIIMNSDLKEYVINDSLIYDDWDKGNPAFLDEEDIDNIEKSNKLFARKVKVDSVLVKRYLLNE